LKRLAAPSGISRIARTHPDWVVRKAAAERIADPEVLAEIASSDADADVRRAALLRLDEKTLAAIGRSARTPEAREQAVALLTDQGLLGEIALGETQKELRLLAIRRLSDPLVLRQALEDADDPDLRAEALDRTIEVEAQVRDPRNVQVRLLLLDPAVVESYGPLSLDFRIRTEERRYIQERDGGTEPPPKGKVLVESVGIAIRRGTEVLFEKTYRGSKARRAEPFNSGAPVQGGYLVRVNPADVDCVEIGEALLEPLDESALKLAAASANKYLRAAALALADSPRDAGSLGAKRDGGEEDED
jgi:hypothetical protein